MAEKMIFISNGITPYCEKIIEYTFVPGFAPSQRIKNVINLNDSINSKYPGLRTLEVSTKSDTELGKKLSAFNLKLDGKYIESIFQSSKVFNDGIQYINLINEKPIDAKRFIQSLPKKEITKFKYNGIEYPIEPKSMFYDFIYICALRNIPEVSSALKQYDIFTDIEFNYKKSINCQARACAIYSYLLKINKVDEYLNNIELFKSLYTNKKTDIITL